MYCRQGLIKMVLMLAMCGVAGFAGAHDHEHSHDAGTPGKLELKEGRKWPTDAHLRQGMDGIRQAMREKKAELSGGTLSADQAHMLSQKVNEQIAFMVQNCKLDRDADAMLHLVLADIIAGAEQMKEGHAGDGAKKISHALENYGTYFEHPGWH